MHVLYETPAGYALFKVSDKAKLTTAESIATAFASLDSAKAALKLKAFDRFEDTTSALSAATAICDNVLDKKLEQFLTTAVKDKDKEKGVAVIDSQLGKLIKEKLGIKPLYDATVLELIRGIRGYADELLGNISKEDSAAVRLGLSHSLSRYKLKFSPDKVDTMIVQAISLLDELDKELNTYAMRVREWYGWHFPEMGRIVTDNIQYAKAVQKMQIRSNAKNTDFSDVLPEEIETLLKEAAEVSMGTDIAEEDILNITALCEQVIKISEYRASLYEYLRNRMSAIAPNLTCMVGELVGARLIAHAGSLLNLAKHPASTVQILGAEKALFRALKTKHDTPKYGLIYHASLVGQAAPKLKGKISRMLAAKTALSIRMDALGDSDGVTIGLEGREKVELRLRQLEGGALQSISKAANKKPDQQKYTKPAVTQSYNTGADVAMKVEPTTNGVNGHANGTSDKDAEKAARKAAKKAKKEVEEAAATTPTPAPATNGTNGTHDDSSSKSSKKSKRKAEEAVEDSKAEAKKSKSSKKDKKKEKA